jgi:hypothetical protein
MRAIKVLVIFMGVLLVAGLGLLGYGMYTKAGKTMKTPPVAEAVPQAVVSGVGARVGALVPFGSVGLDQPAGTSVEAVTVAGAQLVVTLRGGGLADRIVVLDSASQTVIGRLTVDGLPVAEPAADAPAAEETGYPAPPMPPVPGQ